MRIKMLLVITLVLASVLFAGCNRTAPPVDCHSRVSLVNRGLVLVVSNSSDRELSLWVHAFANDDVVGKKTTFSLSPNATEEFGWLQDFHLGTNSTVTIGGEGFASITLKMDELKRIER